MVALVQTHVRLIRVICRCHTWYRADDLPSISPLIGLDNVRSALQPIAAALGGSDANADSPSLLAIARDIQRLISSVITDVAKRADHDPTTPSLDTLLGDEGTVPRSEVRAEIERVRVNGASTAVADQRRKGKAHTGNVDVLARLTRAMTDDEVAALAEHDSALADAAGRLGEESFRKRVTRLRSSAQRSALRALYPSCPISGVGWESIEIHHVIFYEESQRTVLSELVPISRRWHHVWPAATPSCSLRSQHRSHHRHVSQPDGTPFGTIAPPTPINQRDHDLAA